MYFAGWTFELLPSVEWNVYLGPPGIVYPTYIPPAKNILSFFTLQQNSQTDVTFLASRYTNIRKRGPLDTKEYCHETSYNEYIDCEKSCFLKFFNVRIFLSNLNL